MSSQLTYQAAERVVTLPRSKALGVVLRFCICYFAVYAPVVFADLGFLGLPLHWYDYLLQLPVRLTGSLLGLSPEPLLLGQPSDDVYQLCQALFFAIVAGIATAVWSRSEASGDADRRLYHWLRIGLRYVLAYATFHYAVISLLRFQFTDLTLESFITPAGDMRPPELLWAFFGWSWMFTTFLAFGELLGGATLLRRETTLLGALIMGAVLSNVALLNFTYNVPGKSLASHLTVAVGLLVLPDAKRLLDVHVLGRPAPAADVGRDVPGPGLLRDYQILIKTLLIVAFIASPIYFVVSQRGYLWVAPSRHPHWGMYEVPKFSLDGVERESIAGDSLRWRRAIISEDGGRLHLHMADNEWAAYAMSVDTSSHQIRLGGRRWSQWRDRAPVVVPAGTRWDTLTYERSKKGEIRLRGVLEGHRVEILLKPFDLNKLTFFTNQKVGW
jgi:hypothetical protein